MTKETDNIHTENEEFNEWLRGYGKVSWTIGGLGFLFIYNNVKCMGIITKITYQGKTDFDVQIRPFKASDDIGNGAGQSVQKSFNQKR